MFMLQCSYKTHENIVNYLDIMCKRDGNTPMGGIFVRREDNYENV